VPQIHKLLKGGGEEFLPFALAREKTLRSTGLQYASQSFEVDGAKIKVRLEGSQSFIEIEKQSGGYVCLPHSTPHPDGVLFDAQGQRIGPEAQIRVSSDGATHESGIKVTEHKTLETGTIDWQGKQGSKVKLITAPGLSRYQRLSAFVPASIDTSPHFFYEGKKYEVSVMLDGQLRQLELLGFAIAAAEPDMFIVVAVDPTNYGDVVFLTRDTDSIDWVVRRRNLRPAVPDAEAVDGTRVFGDRWHFSEDGLTAVTLARPQGVVSMVMRSSTITATIVPQPRLPGRTRSVSVTVQTTASHDVTKTMTLNENTDTYEVVGQIMVRVADYYAPGDPALFVDKIVRTVTRTSAPSTRVTGDIMIGADIGTSGIKYCTLNIDAKYERTLPIGSWSVHYAGLMHDNGEGVPPDLTLYPPSAAIGAGLGEAIQAWVDSGEEEPFTDSNKSTVDQVWSSGATTVSFGRLQLQQYGPNVGTPVNSVGCEFLLFADARFDVCAAASLKFDDNDLFTARLLAKYGSTTLTDEQVLTTTISVGDIALFLPVVGASQGPSAGAYLFAAGGSRTAYAPGLFARRLEKGFVFSVDADTTKNATQEFERAQKSLNIKLPETAVVQIAKDDRQETKKLFSIGAEPGFSINPIRIF
jgi:hypothetical protein